MNPCTKHHRYYCTDSTCQALGNLGQVYFDSSGPAFGIGGGLTIDTVDGSLGTSIGGFNIDFDGH